MTPCNPPKIILRMGDDFWIDAPRRNWMREERMFPSTLPCRICIAPIYVGVTPLSNAKKPSLHREPSAGWYKWFPSTPFHCEKWPTCPKSILEKIEGICHPGDVSVPWHVSPIDKYTSWISSYIHTHDFLSDGMALNLSIGETCQGTGHCRKRLLITPPFCKMSLWIETIEPDLEECSPVWAVPTNSWQL
jgi:hypothetical protein